MIAMKHEHYDTSGKRILLQGIHRDNKRFPGGWIEQMYRRYNAHFDSLKKMECSQRKEQNTMKEAFIPKNGAEIGE